MAFVVIHHVRDESPGLLVSILENCTAMPVLVAANDLTVLPNHVYVLPSGEEMVLTDNHFQVGPRTKLRGWPNLVSVFVESMSRSHHPGIAVILSGMDANGAASLMKLKQHGGVVIAQEPATASNPDMPRAAIATGTVDYVLEPAAIGITISKLANRVCTLQKTGPAADRFQEEDCESSVQPLAAAPE